MPYPFGILLGVFLLSIWFSGVLNSYYFFLLKWVWFDPLIYTLCIQRRIPKLVTYLNLVILLLVAFLNISPRIFFFFFFFPLRFRQNMFLFVALNRLAMSLILWLSPLISNFQPVAGDVQLPKSERATFNQEIK